MLHFLIDSVLFLVSPVYREATKGQEAEMLFKVFPHPQNTY